jgi:hypothetical protein
MEEEGPRPPRASCRRRESPLRGGAGGAGVEAVRSAREARPMGPEEQVRPCPGPLFPMEPKDAGHRPTLGSPQGSPTAPSPRSGGNGDVATAPAPPLRGNGAACVRDRQRRKPAPFPPEQGGRPSGAPGGKGPPHPPRRKAAGDLFAQTSPPGRKKERRQSAEGAVRRAGLPPAPPYGMGPSPGRGAEGARRGWGCGLDVQDEAVRDGLRPDARRGDGLRSGLAGVKPGSGSRPMRPPPAAPCSPIAPPPSREPPRPAARPDPEWHVLGGWGRPQAERPDAACAACRLRGRAGCARRRSRPEALPLSSPW